MLKIDTIFLPNISAFSKPPAKSVTRAMMAMSGFIIAIGRKSTLRLSGLKWENIAYKGFH